MRFQVMFAVSLSASALCAPLAGCDLFFGNNCEAEPAPTVGLLNPVTGQCDFSFGGGGSTCGEFGGAVDVAKDIAVPDLAACFSDCTGLSEGVCLATPGCRAGYMSDCPEGADCDSTSYQFYECWQTAPSGPVQGVCAGLDPFECSRHDDCAARHFAGDGFAALAPEPPGADEAQPIGRFEACVAEDDAGPDPGSCEGEVACDSLPPGCPPNSVPGIADGCWTGACILVEDCPSPATCADAASEQACVEDAACAPLYQGVGCTCDATGACTCEDLVFEGCEEA